jgi:CRISPR-associated protein Cas6
LHGTGWLGIQNISGRLVDPQTLDLRTGSFVRLRVPADKIPMLLALAGMTIEVQGKPIQLGAPSVQVLRPRAALDAQLVVIRLTGGVGQPFSRAEFDERFAGEANRQLSKIGVIGDLTLRGRRSIEVGGRRIIGHAVGVTGLSPEHSLLLQVHGIGGKRTMGCGLFRPARTKIALAPQAATAP